MRVLPEALAPMSAYKQFMLYKLVPRNELKTDKIPIDYRTLDSYQKGSNWQKDPNAVTSFENAAYLAEAAGPGHGVGFLFTENDPFFFVDIDDCSTADGQWSDIAVDIMSKLPGAAIEVSQSGRGLHAFGKFTGPLPPHCNDNASLHLGFYTHSRFVALTCDRTIGSAALDLTGALASSVLPAYYPPKTNYSGAEWTDKPAPDWFGPEDDGDLIKKACASKSAASTFGGGKSFKALWEKNEAVLSKAYPDEGRGRAYNESSADMALAQYLAFWTGKNHERILALMWKSALVREKWNREDYLTRTITNACSMQKEVIGTPKLKGSPAQQEYADKIRFEKLKQLTQPDTLLIAEQKQAKWWIDNKDVDPKELVKRLTPVEGPGAAMNDEPEFVSGYQLLMAEQQVEYFKGCCYVQDCHRVFIPSGVLLKSEQFNATFGGYAFQIDDANGKTSRKAFEAFTESQCVRFPKVEGTCFRPALPSGSIVKQNGSSLVNTYFPLETPRKKGDPTRFIDHLRRILPDGRDQRIILSYLAAMVQYKGIKFQWAPLLQGAHGNGKSLLSYCIVEAIGQKYSHMPPAQEIDEKFNSWLFGRLFIGVEDIYVAEQRRNIIEVLKPMITGGWLSKRAMQQEQQMQEVCCNFIFNSNHKDALREAYKDRRFSVFFCAQQSEADIIRDGMGGDYFPNIYAWLRNGGFAIVHDYLATYPIEAEFNPAGECHRGPKTSSYNEVQSFGVGPVEQEILEAIEEGRPGFRGGWVSSMALDTLLKLKRKDGAIPINKRRDILKGLGYDWHPALSNGRVNNSVMPDNGKPRLFIQTGHGALLIQSPSEVAKTYEEAQR